MGTVIVLAVLILIVGLIVRSMIRARKKREIHSVRRELQRMRLPLSLRYRIRRCRTALTEMRQTHKNRFIRIY